VRRPRELCPPRHAGNRRTAKQFEAEGLSYRKISAKLAELGHVTRTGKPHVASAVTRMPSLILGRRCRVLGPSIAGKAGRILDEDDADAIAVDAI
jgi:hypothetical protein